jgi:hypothetical protein
MPWKEWNIVEERLRFIARVLDGEKMEHACSSPSGVVSAGGESRGTVSSEGWSGIAKTISVPCECMVR